MEVLKSYLALLALIFAGYGISFQTKSYSVGIILSVFSIMISILFLLLDRRTRDLIKLAENYLKEEEARLAAILQSNTILIFTESDRLREISKNRGRIISYSRLLTEFFWLNIITALIILAVFLFNLAQA
jgi:hypothetical protein